MFLPTEGLYAEVMRRDALQAEIQSQCNVTIVGPSTLFVILTSYRMGFNMLAFQEKGDEVWKILQGAKTEFAKFGTLMDKVEGDVSKIQKTLGEVGVRTRAINRTLREVSDSASSQPTLLEFQDFAAPDLSLAASAETTTNPPPRRLPLLFSAFSAPFSAPSASVVLPQPLDNSATTTPRPRPLCFTLT